MQDVMVTLLASDQSRNLYAQVSHPHGRIAVSLLKQGLDNYVSWTAKMIDEPERTELKLALDEAQRKRVHLYHSFDPSEQ